MTKNLQSVLYSGLGSGLGTLVYTRFIGESHRLDWRRAIFVAIFCAVGSWLWLRTRSK